MLVEHRGSFSSPHQKPKNQEEGGRGVIRVQTGEVDVSITKLPGPGSRVLCLYPGVAGPVT